MGTPALRLAAMHALEDIGLTAQAAIPVLATVLQSPDVQVRLAAARLLGKFGPAALEAKEALRAALRDVDAEVRKTVGDALLQILPPPGATAPVVQIQRPVMRTGERTLIPAWFSPATSVIAPPKSTRRGRTRFSRDL